MAGTAEGGDNPGDWRQQPNDGQQQRHGGQQQPHGGQQPGGDGQHPDDGQQHPMDGQQHPVGKLGNNRHLEFRDGQWDSESFPNYEPGSGFFSMRLHHGGRFTSTIPAAYVGGSIVVADYCSKLNLSLRAFDATSDCLGYGRMGQFVFCDPGLGLVDGVQAIIDKSDVREVIVLGSKHGYIDVYMVGELVVGVKDSMAGNAEIDVNKPVKGVGESSRAPKVKKTQSGKNPSNSKTMNLDSKSYYGNLAREMRSRKRLLKKQGLWKEYKANSENEIPVREVNGVLHLDDEEPAVMDDMGPTVTQPTQDTLPDVQKKIDEEVEGQWLKEIDEQIERKMESENAKNNGTMIIADSGKQKSNEEIQQKIEAEYEKNIAALEARLEELRRPKGKGICKDVGESSKGLGEDGERTEGYPGWFDEDAPELGPRYMDSDFEFEFDPDLAAGRDFWNGLEENGLHGLEDLINANVEDSLMSLMESDESQFSYSSSDSEGQDCGKPKVSRSHRFSQPVRDEDVRFHVGDLFVSKAEFQNACKHHGTVAKRRIRFRRSNRKRCTAWCDSDVSCSWMVSVNYRPASNCWELTKMLLHHSCGTTFNHKCASYKYLAGRYKDELRIMPNMTVRQLMDKVQKDLHINVSKAVAAKARRLALRSIDGDYRQQYIRLKEYCHELRRSNPGSTVVLQTERNAAGRELFRRLYVCFDACKRGFVEGCRPMLGMDGCHLSGPHKGILLTAIGLDANDQIFPVAYALVEIECTSSWLWFLTLLRKDLGMKNSKSWTLLTDKQKGLSNALGEIFPNAEHRMCAWHLYRNFKSASFTSLELKELLWAAAKATHKRQFERLMERIRDAHPLAHAWLDEKNPENWARSHFAVESKCDILVNNICECFNRVILPARDKPILTMLEAIRVYFMDRLQQKRVFISRIQGPLGPKVARKLERSMQESNQWIAKHVGDLVFEVRNFNESRFRVGLQERTCSCRKWQLTGLPCAHAVSAIGQVKEEPVAFVDHYYSREMYLKAYKYIIYPVNGPELWESLDEPGLLPPVEINIGGRPAKARKKGADEKEEIKNSKKRKGHVQSLSRVGNMKPYACRECKQVGHTKKTCPTKIASSSSAVNSASKPLVQQPIQLPAKKAKKAHTCTTCKQSGHNMATCRKKIADRYADHSQAGETDANQYD